MSASKIKHISFDVWNTLITANPEYAKARDKIIARSGGISLKEARELYKKVKTYLDLDAEKGFCGSSATAWCILGKNLDLTLAEISEMKRQCEEAFKLFPPFFDIRLAMQIKDLSEIYSLSVKSNTNFISGEVLKKTCMFKSWGFKFMHFSDHYQFCKPDPMFFNLCYEETGMSDIRPHEILHVGDSKIFDGKCVDVGMKFCHIKNPEDLLKKLINGDLF